MIYELIYILFGLLFCWLGIFIYDNYSLIRISALVLWKVIKSVASQKLIYRTSTRPYVVRDDNTINFIIGEDPCVYKILIKNPKQQIKILSGCKDITSLVKPYIFNTGLTPIDIGVTHLSIVKGGECIKYKEGDVIDFKTKL